MCNGHIGFMLHVNNLHKSTLKFKYFFINVQHEIEFRFDFKSLKNDNRLNKKSSKLICEKK